jgi:precorrin-2 dehydrogenase/sirohydrochlorin ferrochelatase
VPKNIELPFYPLSLRLAGERALVVGAGKVAERKIAALLRAGAHVTVIGPLASGRIKKWRADGKLVLWARKFQISDLRGQRLVFCATDHPEVDRLAAQGALRRGLLVNCASTPELGNFILPATAKAGRVQLAISTGGASPALAGRLARELAAALAPHAEPWARMLAQLRPRVNSQVPRQSRAALWQQLTSDRFASLMRRGQHTMARQLAHKLIAEASSSKQDNEGGH